MKRITEDKKRMILFVLIAIICLLAIIEAVYIVSYSPDGTVGSIGGSNASIQKEDDKSKLKEQFPSIFKNDLTSNIDVTNIEKKDANNNLIYTDYSKSESVKGKYELDVQIPHININTTEINKINNEIDSVFKSTAEKILNSKTKNVNTIFNVKYKAYLNKEILSLIIQCTLKTEENAQKVLYQTYCYNIQENKREKFVDLVGKLGINKSDIEIKIKNEIDSQVLMEKSLEEAGYQVFKRHKESDIYKFDNISSFFVDNDNNLYILFPYGNTNNTSEVDIVIM